MCLINLVIAEDALEEEVKEFVNEIVRHSAVVLRLTTKATIEGYVTILRRIGRIYLEELMKTEDATEGLKAFLENRLPSLTQSRAAEASIYRG
jgi:cyclohexa-1,5-dienecarbonyl-CoA hydratase